MHYSISGDSTERDRWLARCAAFATSSGVDAEQAKATAVMLGSQLPILSPEQDEPLMRKAGFSDISSFYAGLAFSRLGSACVSSPMSKFIKRTKARRPACPTCLPVATPHAQRAM